MGGPGWRGNSAGGANHARARDEAVLPGTWRGKRALGLALEPRPRGVAVAIFDAVRLGSREVVDGREREWERRLVEDVPVVVKGAVFFLHLDAVVRAVGHSLVVERDRGDEHDGTEIQVGEAAGVVVDGASDGIVDVEGIDAEVETPGAHVSVRVATGGVHSFEVGGVRVPGVDARGGAFGSVILLGGEDCLGEVLGGADAKVIGRAVEERRVRGAYVAVTDVPHGLVHVEAVHRNALQIIVAVFGTRRVVRDDADVVELDRRVEGVGFRGLGRPGDEAEAPKADAGVDEDVVDAKVVGERLDDAMPLGKEFGEEDVTFGLRGIEVRRLPFEAVGLEDVARVVEGRVEHVVGVAHVRVELGSFGLAEGFEVARGHGEEGDGRGKVDVS
mmetsp:Transcript_11248/g.28601  ORF Transcript_11248/g.28601 Transcript_11248/m.28601 type:complete len:388 (-) Transcript_11248:982-2145(-)